MCTVSKVFGLDKCIVGIWVLVDFSFLQVWLFLVLYLNVMSNLHIWNVYFLILPFFSQHVLEDICFMF